MPLVHTILWMGNFILLKDSVDLARSGCDMMKYQCTVCGYIYDEDDGDPDGGIPPGTKWEDLPDDWVCPVCGAEKDQFEKLSD